MKVTNEEIKTIVQTSTREVLLNPKHQSALTSIQHHAQIDVLAKDIPLVTLDMVQEMLTLTLLKLNDLDTPETYQEE